MIVTTPLVSVVIPTYARPDNLLRAIDSVQMQTYPNIEIIVVDDNGKGTPFQIETEKVLEHLIEEGKIQYIVHETNKNGSAARNTGYRASKGEYIDFLDDDDVFAPTKIEKQVVRLEQDKQYDACYCNTKIYGKKRNIEWRCNLEGDLSLQILMRKNHFNSSAVLFRRKALDDINGWDERFNRHQDLEMQIRFFRNHKICVASPEELLLEKYTTPNVISRNPKKAVEYREFFLQEMKGDIEASGHQNEIYKCQYEDLCAGLLASGEKKLGVKYFFSIFKYGIPKGIIWVKLGYYLLKG